MSADDGTTPDDLAAALDSEPAALAAWLPPSHRREYVEWIDEAKRPETRQRHIEKAIRMLHG